MKVCVGRRRHGRNREYLQSWNHEKQKSNKQGPRSKFSSGGAKEECVKENLGGGGRGVGGTLVDFYSISLE